MQNASFPVQGGDLPVTNYSVTDIPAGVGIKLDTTAGNYLGVLPVTAGDLGKAFAVTLDKIKAGRPGRVRHLGGVLMTAHGALNPGDIVRVSVSAGFEGQAEPGVAATAQFGRVLTIAADTAEVLVLIERAKNA